MPCDPYFLGLWLGDGHRRSTAVRSDHEAAVREFLVGYAAELGLRFVWRGQLQDGDSISGAASLIDRPLPRVAVKHNLTSSLGKAEDEELEGICLDLIDTVSEDVESDGDDDERLHITRLQTGRGAYGALQQEKHEQLACQVLGQTEGPSGVDTLLLSLRELGVVAQPGVTGPDAGKTGIPALFMRNSRSVRLALLAGFLDTHGWFVYPDNVFGFDQSDDQDSALFWDAVALARSLGFGVDTRRRTMWDAARAKQTPHLVAQMSGNLSEIPCLLARKKGSERLIPRTHSFAIEDIVLESETTDWAGFRSTRTSSICGTTISCFTTAGSKSSSHFLIPSSYLPFSLDVRDKC